MYQPYALPSDSISLNVAERDVKEFIGVEPSPFGARFQRALGDGAKNRLIRDQAAFLNPFDRPATHSVVAKHIVEAAHALHHAETPVMILRISIPVR